MKRAKAYILAALIIVTALCVLTSCGVTKMDDPYLLELPEKGILGMTKDEICATDKYTSQYEFKEKKLDDGTIREKYVMGNKGEDGDAFITGGDQWITNVVYIFDNDALISYSIEYRQTGYSEGLCSKRMTMFTEYLDGKFGSGEATDIGTAWTIGGGVLEMSRQNGGWILFTYQAPEAAPAV